MTIELRLDQEDAAILQQLLEAYLSELRFEIGGTDRFDFRVGLHEQEDRIKRMLGLLNGADSRDAFPASGER